MTEDAFNFVEKMSKMRMESVKSLNRKRQIRSPDGSVYQDRNEIIEEVAQEIEKMSGFGKDTLDSLCVYIRKMKK
jgi:hypothetical protein